MDRNLDWGWFCAIKDPFFTIWLIMRRGLFSANRLKHDKKESFFPILWRSYGHKLSPDDLPDSKNVCQFVQDNIEVRLQFI